MRHTYLLEEGTWQAEGRYVDSEGNEAEVRGVSRIRHRPETWSIEGEMTVEADPPVTFANRYAIRPIPADGDATCWESENPALGKLSGRFALVGDTILSVYRSEDGRYQGTEALVRVDGGRYLGRGVLFDDETRLSSWFVELVRQE